MRGGETQRLEWAATAEKCSVQPAAGALYAPTLCGGVRGKRSTHTPALPWCRVRGNCSTRTPHSRYPGVECVATALPAHHTRVTLV